MFGQIKNNMSYTRFRYSSKNEVFMDFAFFAIVFYVLLYKKMCAQITKEGMIWLIRLDCIMSSFRCWVHINQRNCQKSAA
ncbi:transposase [gut metagenome]|uniref:Transposase n=1 Tax=gut metagenome TaxID=749906 RepID=J9CG48_9ZZZZ